MSVPVEVFVRDLQEASACDRSSAGGKAAGLAELTAAGVPVPAGYVIVTGAFRRAVAAVDPSGELRRALGGPAGVDGAVVHRAAATLRERITRGALPTDVRDQIAAAYRALVGGSSVDGAVAVRSSATGEDAADASFAGLQDSYLWVRGIDAVLDRVRDCWASLYNTEAVVYRRRMGVPEDDAAMAVVVQRMVTPRSAGVMFTRGPVTGDRSVVAVEGTWGLGSALAGGDVTPDTFTVSKVTGEVVARRIASKTRIHRMRPDGCGVEVAAMPGDLRDRPCLTDEELRALARIGRAVEDHYGAAQDIEWAVVDDATQGDPRGLPPGESIVILQARPETVWVRRERMRPRPVAVPAARSFDHVLRHLGGRRGSE